MTPSSPAPRHRAVAVVAALLMLGAGGCGDEPASPSSPGAGHGGMGAGPDDVGGTMSGSGMEAPTSVWDPHPEMGAPTMRFRDVSELSRIHTVNHSGTEGVKEFLLEAVGVGPAWLDYDRDGLLDVYVPDGDVFANYELVHELDPATRVTRPLLVKRAEPRVRFKDQLWRNNGDGTFTDVAEQAGVADERWSFGATACDVDADGWTDIYVANYGANRLWRNNGDGSFTDLAVELGALAAPGTWSTCSAVADLDGDERLDFYVPAYSDPADEVERQRRDRGIALGAPVETISGRSCRWKRVRAYCGPIGLKGQHDAYLRQTADGTFEDAAQAVGMRPRVAQYGFQALTWDFDEDGRIDVYVANDSVESFLWQAEADAEGRLTYRDVSDWKGVKFGRNLSPQAGMGAAVADIDGDGMFDIFKTNFSLDYNNMYMAQRQGAKGAVYYKDAGLVKLGQAVFYDLSWGCGWLDFDNDADLDLYVANGHVYKEIDLQKETGASYDQWNTLIECIDPKALDYREIGTKAAENLSRPRLGAGDGLALRKCSRGCAFADFNNDGRVDMLVTNMNQPPNLILNVTPHAPDRNWALLSLEQPGMNREALGARLDVTAGGRTQARPVIRAWSFLGSNDPRVHVGLGAATTFDVKVTWPGTKREVTHHRGLVAGKHWVLKRDPSQGEKAWSEDVPLRTFDVPVPPEK
jgi:hypothetical protein